MSSPPNKVKRPRTSLVKLLGFVAIFAGGAAMFGSYAKYEAQASWLRTSEAVSAEVSERAAALQEWLLRLDRTLNWFRPEDIAAVDRLALTGRMLRTERFVAPARSLFLFTPAGRLAAGTLPLPEGSSGVSTKPWFKAIQGNAPQAGLQITGCAHDPFGSEEGVVISRSVFDHETVVGYVGSFLPQAALARSIRDDDPTNGTIALSLQLASGEALGCAANAIPGSAAGSPGLVRGWLARVIHASPDIATRSAVREDRAIEPGGLHLIATADVLDAMSNEDWMAVAYRASYVAISLLLIMALMSSLLHRAGRPVRSVLPLNSPNSVANGADWMWELDDAGNLVGLAGNAPEHLLPPSGRSLPETAGPIGGSDMRWDRLITAICAKQAFEGLQVPFQIPGRSGLLTIFEFSGQPVVASGGFWGTASLVSEESVAVRASASAGAAAQLSVA